MDTGESREHQVILAKSLFKKDEIQKLVSKRYKHADDALFTLFCSAYFVGNTSIPFSKFPALCRLLRFVTYDITMKMYHDDKSCAEVVHDISLVLQQKILEKVRALPFYGLMIDESTDISSTGHLIVFCNFIDEGRSRQAFLGLLHVGQKDSALISTTLMSMLNSWELDYGKCVAFGSDGAATMVGSMNGVAQRLKRHVNPFLLSCHCVAHRTNLAALAASKVEGCKVISDQVDVTLNQVAAFFHYSSKHKAALSELHEALADARKVMKRYLKIRWLSRHAAVASLCDSLESVLTYFQDNTKSTDQLANVLFVRLADFKMIYVIYFLADILGNLAKLSKIFQQQQVDVTTVGSIVSAIVTEIRMNYIMEATDLNGLTFDSNTGYPILPDYGPPGGYLKRLQSEIRGNYFHTILLCRDQEGLDLAEVVSFQKSFAQAVCVALESRFSDNDLISCFKVLNPRAVLSTAMGILEWGFKEIDQLCAFFSQTRCTDSGVSRPGLVDGNGIKVEYRVFKIQCMSEWSERSFHEVWQMISTNPTYSCQYSSLLKLADIARVQCVSTAICERAFSIQNCIKTKIRNSLQTKHLEASIRLSIEGPDEEYEDYLLEAITIWKGARSHRFLFSNPDMHLPSSSSSGYGSANGTQSSVCNAKFCP